MGEVDWIYDVADTLTAQDLSDRHGHGLPLLVVVVNGFFANREEMCFSTGQVLRLQELRQQRRALVHDDQKKTLSVPLDYAHRVHVGQDTTTAMTIGEICERHKLPVKVRFADPNMRFDCGPLYGTRSFNTLKIVRQHEESYFVANSVMQGQLLKTVITIPMYLKDVRFCVITGARGRGLTDGGRGLMRALLHAQARDLDFAVAHGDTEMVQLSEKPIKATDNIYQNIETNIYINVHHQTRQRRQQPQPTTTTPPPSTTTATSTTTPPQTHQDRDGNMQGQRRRLAKKPCPPLPGDADVGEGEGATCTLYSEVREEEGESYVNLAQLQGSAVSQGSSFSSSSSPAGGDEGVGGVDGGDYEVTCHTSRPEDGVVYYDPDHEETGVYEPVNMDSVRRKGANPYTSLEPAPSQPTMASELQKALKKRQERTKAAAAAGGGGGGQGKGEKGGSTRGPEPGLGHPRGSPGKDVSGRSGPGSPKAQPVWKVNLRPVNVNTKLSMSPQPDATSSSTDAVPAGIGVRGVERGGGGVGGGGGVRERGGGGGGTSRTVATSPPPPPSPQATPPPPTTSITKPKSPKSNPQIDSSEKPVLKKKPACVGGQKSPPPPPQQQQQQQQPPLSGTTSSGTALKGTAVPPQKGPGRGKDPAQATKGSAKTAVDRARPVHSPAAAAADDDDVNDDPQQQQQPPPVERPGMQQTPPARFPVSNNNSDNNNDGGGGGGGGGERIYVNEVEMAVVTPTQSPPPPSSSSGSGSGGKVAGKVRVEGQVHGQVQGHVQGQVTVGPVSDRKRTDGGEQPPASLPLDQPLDLWTMDDVTQLLTSLNLARHSADFREAQVDGKLLQQLTSDMLKEEFSMGGIAIIKLTNFVQTGHLPK